MPFRLRAAAAVGLRSGPQIHAELRALAAEYPEVTRLEILGHSAEGRPLLALRIADHPDDTTRPTILLTAAHHANEAATPEHVLEAARTILHGRYREPYDLWLQQMTLVVVPLVNPDGSHAFWEVDDRLGRKSRRVVANGQRNLGVDLNRNYPFRWDGSATRFSSPVPGSRFYIGPTPASEPEVRAMIGQAQRDRPVAMISYHSAAARLLVPYAVVGANNPSPSAAWSVARDIIAHLPHSFGRRSFRAIGALYPVTGVEKDWYHHSFGTLAYVVELPYRRPTGARLAESLEHTRGTWMALFERWLSGPSLSVRAVDRGGRPVEVSIRFDEITTQANERWTTNPDHGWFHYYLPAPGRYTVRLSNAVVTVVREIVVEHGWARIEIEIPQPLTLLADAAP